ncbi:hypothetical protein Tco_1288100 [Tanacetum coccineum]
MENANPSSTIESVSQESFDTTHVKFTAQINKLLTMRHTIDSLLFKTINEMTNQSFDSEIFCPEERIKAKNMHIFIGCFVYVVDFMILEDLGSIIDSGLCEVVLGQPFARTSKLTHDESLGLIRFAKRDDEVMFRMPQRTKELDRISPFEKDKFEVFLVDSLKVRKMGFKHVLDKRK